MRTLTKEEIDVDEDCDYAAHSSLELTYRHWLETTALRAMLLTELTGQHSFTFLALEATTKLALRPDLELQKLLLLNWRFRPRRGVKDSLT